MGAFLAAGSARLRDTAALETARASPKELDTFVQSPFDKVIPFVQHSLNLLRRVREDIHVDPTIRGDVIGDAFEEGKVGISQDNQKVGVASGDSISPSKGAEKEDGLDLGMRSD